MHSIVNLPLMLEAATSWGYHPSGDLSRGQLICCQAYGFRGPEDVSEELRIPGPPNERMGVLARNLKISTGLPMSAQGEVVQTRAMQGITVEKPIFHHHIPEEYVSCYEIETQTWIWMQENSWTRVIIVTHPLLVWRMKKVFEKLGAEVIVPQGLEVVGYDPENTQRRTHNVPSWVWYEFFARGHHILHNWI